MGKRRYWSNDPRDKLAAEWERRRLELLGYDAGRLRNVAAKFGVSIRTLERYEFDGAPAWYELALIGLANAKRREPPPATG